VIRDSKGKPRKPAEGPGARRRQSIAKTKAEPTQAEIDRVVAKKTAAARWSTKPGVLLKVNGSLTNASKQPAKRKKGK
jgi:hypothetical protein